MQKLLRLGWYLASREVYFPHACFLQQPEAMQCSLLRELE